MKELSKYLQIENDIIEKIRSQKLKTGEQIMTEQQLCSEYKVSRMTINKAISALVADGYLRRIAGKGTFVQFAHKRKNVGGGNSFSSDMQSIGLVPGSRLVEYRIARGDEFPEVRDMLKMAGDDMMHYFIRLRTANDMPVAVSYTYIPCRLLPALDVTALEGSLYSYLDSVGLSRSYLEGNIIATMPTKEHRQLLGVENEALLRNAHLTYLANGDIVEYNDTYYAGSRYTYTYTSRVAEEKQ